MAIHKVSLDDYYNETYVLIAIHTRLQAYKLAYMLNKYLSINLMRDASDLDVDYTKSSFSLFEYYNEFNDQQWHLISNICKKEEESVFGNGMLFNDNKKIVKTYNLLPELKNVDFLLKINNDIQQVNEKHVLNLLHNVPQIITSYVVDNSKIISKEHLIF